MKKQVAVIGGGKIGSMIVDLLSHSGDYDVTVADRSHDQLDRLETDAPVERVAIDITDVQTLSNLVRGKFAVLSAAPYHLTTRIAEAAKANEAHYLDLTEDVASTRFVKKLAEDAQTAFIPQCGLAPGFITIVAYDLARHFDTLQDVRMRVGALPKYPANALNYNLTWSTDGRDQRILRAVRSHRERPAVAKCRRSKRCEEFSLDGVTYEAFNTSGGLGTLCETLARQGAQSQLPHDPLSRPLRDHEGAAERPAPARSPRRAEGHSRERPARDASGRGDRLRHGQRQQERAAHPGVVRQQDLRADGERSSCAAPSRSRPLPASARCWICSPQGDLPSKGFVRQEDIPLERFLQNRFGRAYAQAELS